ncbi:nitroreductase family protein [Alistipes sp. OttesenSCG-928-L06]|nr:nitroreductase family protein [Alistipes sp. OttesenSCG-928-L06]
MKKMIGMLGMALLLFSCNSTPNTTEEVKKGYTDTETIETIFNRKSVRAYENKIVEPEKIDLLLRAGMAAPSGMDRRPWELVVLNDKEAMASLAESLPYAKMLAEAPMAIIVCGDPEKSHYWYIDCSAVTQNILLAAEALGLGAVWTGAYPSEERMAAIAEAIGLPANILPLNVIPVGYPAGEHLPKDKYNEAKVHYNKW